MADAPNTSCYLVTELDTANLPNNRLLYADPVASNLQFLDSGPGQPYTLAPTLRLASITTMTGAGLMAFNGTNTITPRTITSADTILVTNGNALSANPVLEVISDTSKQKVSVQTNGNAPAGERANINFINGNNVTISAVDNSGSNRMDVTVSAASGLSENASVALLSSDLNHSFNLGSLASGILKQTVSSGVATPSIAVANTDYVTPSTGLLELRALTPGVGNIIISNASAWTSLAAGAIGTILGINGSGQVAWVTSSAAGAPANSTYLCQTSSNLPTFGVNLGDPSAVLGIGTTTPGNPLHMVTAAATPINLVNTGSSSPTFTAYSSTGGIATQNSLFFQAARGTSGTPAAVQANDVIGGMRFLGWDGSSFVSGATILGVAQATQTPSNHSTALQFHTSDGVTSQLALTINPDRTSSFTGLVTLQSGVIVNGGTTTLATGYTVTGGTGGFSSGSTLSMASGSTFTLAAGAAFNANGLPASGNVLTYNGTNVVWAAPSGDGTVTSVGLSSSDAFITVSGSPVTTSGTLAMTINTLGATKGGTAQTTYATGDTLYASASNTLSKLTIGSQGQLNTVSSGGIPQWTNTIDGTGALTIGASGVSKAVNVIGTGTVTIGANAVSQALNILGTGTVTFGNSSDAKQIAFTLGTTTTYATGSVVNINSTINQALTSGNFHAATLDSSSGGDVSYTLYSSIAATGPAIKIGYSRGTPASPVAVNGGDRLGFFIGRGHNGTAMANGSNITINAKETWSLTANGCDMQFYTVPLTTTTPTLALTLNTDQTASFAGQVKADGGLAVTGNTTLQGTTFNSGWGLQTGAAEVRTGTSLTIKSGSSFAIEASVNTLISNTPIFEQGAEFDTGGVIAVRTDVTLRCDSGSSFQSGADNRFTSNVAMGSNTAATHTLQLFTDDAAKTTTTTWTVTSDERVKTDIVDVEEALPIVNALMPRKYRYTDEWKKAHQTYDVDNNPLSNPYGDKEYYGFIADEVMKVMPSCVTITDQTIGSVENIKTLNTHNLSILLFKAIKELSAKVDALESQINGG